MSFRQSRLATALGLLALVMCVPVSLGAADVPASPISAIPDKDDAPIALMMDMASGQVLHSREADRRFVPASMTKVMTAFLAFEMIEKGQLDLKQTFPVRDETFRKWSGRGSSMDVAQGARISVEDLLLGITTVSANDGSIVLAEGVAGSEERWTALMNEKAREIGMLDSHFGTANGWPDEGRTFVTAEDLATLARAMLLRNPDRYSYFFGRPSFTYGGQTQPNRDPISGTVEGADGIKTGFTRQAGNGFLGSAARDGQRLIMVVGGAPDEATRAQVSREYLEWGFAAFEPRKLFAKGNRIGSARVQGGDSSKVGLFTESHVSVPIARGAEGNIGLELRYSGPVRAPIARGDEIAALRITVDGGAPSDVPLYAANDVGLGGPLDRLRDGLYSLLP